MIFLNFGCHYAEDETWGCMTGKVLWRFCVEGVSAWEDDGLYAL